MVERGHLHVRLVVADAVREGRGAEQVEVRGVGEQRAMQFRRVADAFAQPEPDLLVRRALGRVELVARIDVAELERPHAATASAAPWSAAWPAPPAAARGAGSMSSGLGTSGIDSWCSPPSSSFWNEAAQEEDRLAVLDRGDAAHREAAAVAGAVDLVDDRLRRCRRRAGSRRAANARCAARLSIVACAADSAWPSTWPPNTYLVPMSRLWPRNRLSSRRSSESSSTSSETTGSEIGGRSCGGARLEAGADYIGRMRQPPLGVRLRSPAPPARGFTAAAVAAAIAVQHPRPREQRPRIALARHLHASGRRWRRPASVSRSSWPAMKRSAGSCACSCCSSAISASICASG